MAHAVSGSAYSAKGGNLKFADVVRERFRGPAFGQDFTTWLDEVLLGFETANISHFEAQNSRSSPRRTGQR